MSGGRKVLLCVLDRDELRSSFNQTLARTPHAVIYAFDGAEGFDRFLEGRPDVCLVCEGTSRISGSILCQLIREHRLGRGVGVYLLSPHPDDPDLQARARAQGVDGVLPSAPDPARLLAILESEHAFRGEPQNGEEPEVEALAERTPPPAAQPVVVDADEVFEQTAPRSQPDSVTLHLRAPAPGAETPTGDGVIELTPAMLKRASSAAASLPGGQVPPAPAPAPSMETVSPDRTDPGPARPEAMPPEVPAPAAVDLGPPAAAIDDEDHPPFSEPADVTNADPAQLAAAALGLMGQPVLHDPREVTDPDRRSREVDAVASDADAMAEEPTPVGQHPAVRAAAIDEPSAEPPTPEEPTPVGAVGAATRAAAGDDLVVAEEPTPVEQRPPVDIDEATAQRAAEPGDVFASPADDGTGSEVSGVFPLAPEERDSHTIRQAISDSQLGGRLTRRILALYRLLDSIDYYQLLGVAPDADAAILQQAFHGLALEYHPDRFFALSPGFIKERLHALFIRMCEAYTVLSSSERRTNYDALLQQRGAGPVPRYPLGEVTADQGDRASEAATPVGRKYLRLAFAALARGDLDAAHLNLSFAIGHEPDNAALRGRLGEMEQRLQEGR